MSRLSMLAIIALASFLGGCTNVEGTAEKVFSNANDAIKPENNTIWWESNADDSSKKENQQATPQP
jgi:hypothetical protein